VASAFADISVLQLILVAGVALFASVIGGVAGYGTGALMPLVLVPLVGPEPVVPMIAISALLTNTGRALAFRRYIDARRSVIVVAAAIPFCILSAYCLGGSVTYTRDENYASFLRTGLTGQTTQAQFTDSEAIVGRFSARYAFGAPAPAIVDTAAFATCP
jgi:hypothetical protein